MPLLSWTVLCSCADEDAKAIPTRQLLKSAPAAIQQDALRGKALALIWHGNAEAPEALLLEIYHACKVPLLSWTVLCADEDAKAIPVRQLLESVPAAVQQDALRGKALALIQQRNAQAAKALLLQLVSQQQFAQVQHLTQADYGILLHQQGKSEVGMLPAVLVNNLTSFPKCTTLHRPTTTFCCISQADLWQAWLMCSLCWFA